MLKTNKWKVISIITFVVSLLCLLPIIIEGFMDKEYLSVAILTTLLLYGFIGLIILCKKT